MSLWSIYWILRAVGHIFLLLVILFLTWYLYLYTRNTNRLQDESESENQTVDTETDSSNVNRSRDEGSDAINNVCSHGNGQQQIHPVISTVSDLGSTAEAIPGRNTNEEQNTISKTRTNFLTLDDACLKGDLNNLKDLIESGHDINERFEGGMTPVLYCSQSGIEPVSKIKMILDKGGNIDDIDIINDNVLHLACKFGRLKTVQYLLQLGLDVHSTGLYDNTPILYCSQSGIEPVSKIKMILDNGGNIDDRDIINDNVLHLACKFGRLKTVQYLLQLGLDFHSRDLYGRTPILYCSQSDIEPVSKIKMILDNGGNIYDIDTANNNILHLACKYGCLETVDYLLQLGLDIKSINRSGQTPLDFCRYSVESDEMIKLLEEKLKLLVA